MERDTNIKYQTDRDFSQSCNTDKLWCNWLFSSYYPVNLFIYQASLVNKQVAIQCESKIPGLDLQHLHLGLHFHLSVIIEILMETKKTLKMVLFDCPSSILRPLCNSNVARVSIKKWYQIDICVARSLVSSKPKNVQNACFAWFEAQKSLYFCS